MNRFWLKISGIVVLFIVVVAVAAYIFWPAETQQIAESKDKRPQLKAAKIKLQKTAVIFQSEKPEIAGEGLFYPDEKIAVKYPDNLQPGQQVTLPRNRSPLGYVL